MRITIVANQDLAANYALNLLLPKLNTHQLSLFLSTRVGAASAAKAQDLIELGQLDRQTRAQLEHGATEFKSFAQLDPLLSRPHQILDNINSPEGMAVFAATQPDLVLSIRYGKILKSPVIQLAKHGVLNLHSGLLPDYRGVMATFWAMLNDEQHIGTTLHYIPDSGIDTGDILGTTLMAVEQQKSYQWHVLTLYQQGVELMSDIVAQIAGGQTPTSQQQPAGGNYFSYPTQAQIDAFKSKGLSLWQPTEVAQVLANH